MTVEDSSINLDDKEVLFSSYGLYTLWLCYPAVVTDEVEDEIVERLREHDLARGLSEKVLLSTFYGGMGCPDHQGRRHGRWVSERIDRGRESEFIGMFDGNVGDTFDIYDRYAEGCPVDRVDENGVIIAKKKESESDI